MRFEQNHRGVPEIGFTAVFQYGAAWHWTILVQSVSLALDELAAFSFSRQCLELWHRIRNAPIEAQLEELADSYERGLRYCRSFRDAEALREQYERERAGLARRRREPRRGQFIGIDYGAAPGQVGGFLNYQFFERPVDTRSQDRAERRALKLLKQWLSPAQLASYERAQHFDVIGCDSGKRYRIRHGTQMNIEELDEHGSQVCGWCFLPGGGLVAGDVMLAQKIALETGERAALKVANRIDRRAPLYGSLAMDWRAVVVT